MTLYTVHLQLYPEIYKYKIKIQKTYEKNVLFKRDKQDCVSEYKYKHEKGKYLNESNRI